MSDEPVPLSPAEDVQEWVRSYCWWAWLPVGAIAFAAIFSGGLLALVVYPCCFFLAPGLLLLSFVLTAWGLWLLWQCLKAREVPLRLPLSIVVAFAPAGWVVFLLLASR